jgi:hypothetical protein
MSKKHKPIHEQLAEIGRQAISETTPSPLPQPVPYRRTAQPLGLSLDEIRAHALKEHANVAHTIADLEAWRMEIDATIAFLKSQ